MRIRPAPRNFSGGELAPWLDGISNELTQRGCRTVENLIIKKQGQATQRPGTFFVNEVKDSSKATGLVPVTIDDNNTYVLEIGDAYIRFYKNHARITYSATTTIYEVTSPWSTGDLSDLRWCYVPNEKTLLFANSSYSISKLIWTSDASWQLQYANPTRSKIIIAGMNRNIYSTRDWNTFDKITWPLNDAQNTQATDGLFWKGKYLLALNLNVTSPGYVMISEDADTWVDVSPGDLTTDSRIPFYFATDGNSIIVSSWVNSNAFYVTTDCTSWTKVNDAQFPDTPADFVYQTEHSYWLACGDAQSLGYSKDGISWLALAVPAWQGYGIAFTGSTTLIAGCSPTTADSSRFYVSSAAISGYTLVASLSPFQVRDIAYGEPGGTPLWVAVGAINNALTSPELFISADMATWTSVTLSADLAGLRGHRVRWVNNRFVAVFRDNAGTVSHKMVTSGDGTTWEVESKLDLPRTLAVSEESIFSEAGGYPSNLAYHEGRIYYIGSRNNPSRIDASATSEHELFELGFLSSDAIEYDIAGPDNVDIRWIFGGLGALVVGTRTAEGILMGSQEEGITPLTAQFRWLSTFGSAPIQPVRIHNMIVFVQRGGEVIRGYIPQAQAYQSPDLTAVADHIAEGGVVSLHHQDDPQTMVYAIRNDGQVAALTFNGQMIAWSRIKMASTSLSVGIVESMAISPTTGAEDEIWLIVNRKVAAGTKRMIEYLGPQKVESLTDAHYLDSGVSATSTVAFGTVTGLDHLDGQLVDALIDGTRWVSGLTVTSGAINCSPYSGTTIHAGLPYTSRLQTMRADYGSSYGAGAGLNKRTSKLLAWVHDSTALARFGPTSLLATEVIAYSSSTTLNTELCEIAFPGEWNRDGYIWCVVNDPRPFTLVAMLADTETSDR